MFDRTCPAQRLKNSGDFYSVRGPWILFQVGFLDSLFGEPFEEPQVVCEDGRMGCNGAGEQRCELRMNEVGAGDDALLSRNSVDGGATVPSATD
ncbi:hypothetical protein OH786_35660 (plasmid) [Streptomyces atratus]|uniref:hypothetical protein n=1 Tax=Streptomyces atratus TaxID=1893 RepID=UPI002F913ED0